MTSIEVKKFTSYRSFLLAYIDQSKQRRANWTFGIFAKQLGLKDTSSITKIIRGARDPGPVITNRLIEHFKFTDDEAEYFRNLVRLEKIKDDPTLSAILMERLTKNLPGEAAFTVDEEIFKSIPHWYCYAIREMVALKDFVEDADWISKKLKFEVNPADVAKTIDQLLAADLLLRKSGKLHINEGRLRTKSNVRSEIFEVYRESVLDLAKASIRHTDLARREMVTTVFSMNEARVPEAKELIREFKFKFAKLLEEPKNADVTVQFQMQFFRSLEVKAKFRTPATQAIHTR